MKHNISITMDQKLFRELENIRGREKRSTFIEHLILIGLKNYPTTHKNLPLNHINPQPFFTKSKSTKSYPHQVTAEQKIHLDNQTY